MPRPSLCARICHTRNSSGLPFVNPTYMSAGPAVGRNCLTPDPSDDPAALYFSVMKKFAVFSGTVIMTNFCPLELIDVMSALRLLTSGQSFFLSITLTLPYSFILKVHWSSRLEAIALVPRMFRTAPQNGLFLTVFDPS